VCFIAVKFNRRQHDQSRNNRRTVSYLLLNKEYLKAISKFYLFSCYLLISEHFGESCVTLCHYDARLQCYDAINFVRFFLDHPVESRTHTSTVLCLELWPQNTGFQGSEMIRHVCHVWWSRLRRMVQISTQTRVKTISRRPL